MKVAYPFRLYSTLILYFSMLASAWPWPRFLPDIDSLIVRRADAANTPSIGPGQGTLATTAPAVKTDSASSAPTDNSASGAITSPPSGSTPATGSGKKSSSTKATVAYTTSYDPRLPPGGISMVTPAPTASASYYKIGNYVTFAWNYTSLLATPKAIDVIASCAGNHQTYTLLMNMTVSNATQAVTWDTAAYQTDHPAAPLAQDIYTLIIYDAASAITAVPQAGYLAPQSQFTFGMYATQPYSDSPTSGYSCAICSGALSTSERQAIGLMLVMGTITTLSFTWFLGGVDIVW